eukprot:Pgem_evm1s9581
MGYDRFAEAIKWRAIYLSELYGWDYSLICKALGCSDRTLRRWLERYRNTGNVGINCIKRKSAWGDNHSVVLNFISEYVKENPLFYLEEVQDAIRTSFPDVESKSLSTICRVITKELHLTRKMISKRAYEAKKENLEQFEKELNAWYSYPGQVVFMDEVSKNAQDTQRKTGRSFKGTELKARIPFGKGKRVSVLAMCDSQGFIGGVATEGTFNRERFHYSFTRELLPLCNPYPQPRSIVVMDNARIHCYSEIFEKCHEKGIVLLTLPPYSPHLNPIETAFSLVKQWLRRHVNASTSRGFLLWQVNPIRILQYALNCCTQSTSFGVQTYLASGYYENAFRLEDDSEEEEEIQVILDGIDNEFITNNQ